MVTTYLSKDQLFVYKDEIFPLRIRINPKAKRLILKVQKSGKSITKNIVILTVPAGAHKDEALEFVEQKVEWVLKRLAKLPTPKFFKDGQLIPFLGVDHKIRHEPDGRRGVWRENLIIHVSGGAEFLPRRLLDWLKKEAHREIVARVNEKVNDIKIKPAKITIRDPRTRWGSCSFNRHLSFSWRLVLAPEFVLDYVVSHEVAHMREHNHSQAFWKITRELSSDIDKAKEWLRTKGETLHAYGKVI